MRIGGLASGIDTDSIIKDLMKAERIPLDKMEQDKTKLEWQRDSFRDVNKKLLELDNMMLDMKMSKTYNSKSVTSSMEGAVIATSTSSSTNGTYNINVEKLATSAINIGTENNVADPDVSIGTDYTGEHSLSYFDEDGKAKNFTFEIKAGDTVNDVLKKITDGDNPIRAFFADGQVVFETTRTGNYNEDGDFFGGAEIIFGTVTDSETDGKTFESESDTFFTEFLGMVQGKDEGGEKGGENASFTYNNNLDLTSKNNNYTLNGITFQFNDITDDKNATLTVNNDVDASFDNIMAFVDKYNDVVETLNGSQQEQLYRDFPPLTDAQREEMSDNEIELWEEKAKSGLLKGESAISSGLFDMRQSWYSTVETGGQFSSLTQIGIATSSDYLDGGKLIVNEEELKAALSKDPESVQKLFSNSKEDSSRGLVNRLEDAVESTMNRINERAGKGTDTLENYTLGKRMKDLEDQIDAFEDRITQIEDRYWRQFSAMEQAISMMNNQSAMLMSNFQ
nr:flagellar hook-associated protein 2 [Oceanobacillus rekensis]